MRTPFLFRGFIVLLLCWGSISVARASHVLGADLTYEYIGTAANPNLYHVVAHILADASSPVDEPQTALTCGKNECGTTLPGSFSTMLVRTSRVLANTGCSSGFPYWIHTLEGQVTLAPAHWTLSVNFENRASGIVNVTQSNQNSVYVKADLDNTNGLINSSPRFTTERLLMLSDLQAPQHYSLSAFDSEGDSLVYQLVQPQAALVTNPGCGFLTMGAIAPHFVIDASTGQLTTTTTGPTQQGRFTLAARTDEYRRVNSSWQQIGSITRDMTYFVAVSGNQLPAFTRVATASNPAGQLLGQTIRVNPGQTLSLRLTATDADASQVLTLSSRLSGTVPGTTFQDLGNGQGLLTWQVPASQPLGRYVLTATSVDNACPTPGSADVTIPVLVTQQVLAATTARQPLAQLPYPTPFQDEVQFQLMESGRQLVWITDAVGRQVAQLFTAPDGRLVWRPAANVPAGIYLARSQQGTQVARLAYSGR